MEKSEIGKKLIHESELFYHHSFLIPYINMSYLDLSRVEPEKEHQLILKALEEIDSNPMVGTSWYVISRTWWDKWE